MSTRQAIKSLLPPLLADYIRRKAGRGIHFSGRPRDWSEACRMSTGYSERSILERVIESTRAVVNGQAVYERDSVLFHTHDYPFPILAALLRAAMLNDGKVEVIDFGGSLGSTYRQCRPFLVGLTRLRWHVIEQPAFVTAGQREFSTDELSFAESLDRVGPLASPPVILTSGALQFVEDPSAILQGFAQVGATLLVLDRTPLCSAANDRLCIQHVPEHIYAASYPHWIFSRSRLLAQLGLDWRLLCEFPTADGHYTTDDGLDLEFRGLIFHNKP